MKSELLVTGGSGLLGHALRRIMPKAFYANRRDADLRQMQQVESLFKKLKPKRVIHLAARVGGVKENASHNESLFADNTLINLNVLHVARTHQSRRVISLLSACCYAYYQGRASNESDLHVGLPYEGNLGYGVSKRLLDIQSRLVRKETGYGFSTITPVTMYGPHDNFDLNSGHVVAALIKKCIAAKQKNHSFVIWGSGEAVRQFVFVDDVARVLQSEITKDKRPESMIIAPDSGLRIKELAILIADIVGFRGKLIFDKSKPEGQRKRVLRSLYFRKEYPQFKFTPLHEGLKMTLHWYLKSHKK